MENESVKPQSPIEILGDGKYFITEAIDGKIVFTLHPDFIRRIETIEILLGSQVPLVNFLKEEWKELKFGK